MNANSIWLPSAFFVASAASYAGGGSLPVGETKSAPTYSVSEIVPPNPYTMLSPHAVNDLGHIEGIASNDKQFDYVYWSSGTGMVVLKPPQAVVSNIAGINNLDQLAVNTSAGPFIWSPSGGWNPIAQDPGMVTTYATSINDRAELVGYAFSGDGGESDTTRRAVRWGSDGVIREIRPNSMMVPADINYHQDFVSTLYTTNSRGIQRVAVLATHLGEYTKLGELAGNGAGIDSVAVGVAENDLVALNSPQSPIIGDVACFWSAKRGVTSLGLGHSEALGISRRGTIVGNVPAGNNHDYYAFAWNLRWGAINLADHLAEGSPNFDIISSNGISGGGTIAAVGYDSAGNGTGILLIPNQ
jgi:hypothetical protein